MSNFITTAIPAPENFRFPRGVRLRASRDFAQVRSQGRAVHGKYMRLSAVHVRAEDAARFGIITSRRVGGAVHRNRVRRRLREICRLNRAAVPSGWLLVISAKSTAVDASFDQLCEEWLLLTRRLSILPRSA